MEKDEKARERECEVEHFEIMVKNKRRERAMENLAQDADVCGF